jgi:hypothetical protein
VHHLDAGRDLEQLDGQVTDGAHAERGKIDLAWIGFGISDEFRNGLGGDIGIDVQHQRQFGEPGHRRNVALKVERQGFVEQRIDHVRRHGEQQRVAVGRRVDDRLHGDIGAAARFVLDDHRLAEPGREPLAQQACDEIDAAAGRKWHDPA